jgi:hypothetical protein
MSKNGNLLVLFPLSVVSTWVMTCQLSLLVSTVEGSLETCRYQGMTGWWGIESLVGTEEGADEWQTWGCWVIPRATWSAYDESLIHLIVHLSQTYFSIQIKFTYCFFPCMLILDTPKHDILLCYTVTSKQCFPDQKRWEATTHILKNLFPCRKHTEEYPYRIQFSDLKSRTWGEPCPESSPPVALGKGGREYVTVRERNWNWAQKSPYLIAHWFRMVLGEI